MSTRRQKKGVFNAEGIYNVDCEGAFSRIKMGFGMMFLIGSPLACRNQQLVHVLNNLHFSKLECDHCCSGLAVRGCEVMSESILHPAAWPGQ